MKRFKNIIVFIALWSIAYYFGEVEKAAFDNVWNYKDLIAMLSGLSGMYYFYKAVTNA